MNCKTLAERIEQAQPESDPRDVARLCLLLSNSVDSLDVFEDDETFETKWKDVALRLHAATDQHAAMTAELEDLARSDPQQFTPDQIWILIRAIKVQSQVLQLYVGDALIDV